MFHSLAGGTSVFLFSKGHYYAGKLFCLVL